MLFENLLKGNNIFCHIFLLIVEDLLHLLGRLLIIFLITDTIIRV